MADVPQHAAGADRGELLIITDQPDTRPVREANWTAVSRERSVGRAGFINDHHGGRADRGRPVGQVTVAVTR